MSPRRPSNHHRSTPSLSNIFDDDDDDVSFSSIRLSPEQGHTTSRHAISTQDLVMCSQQSKHSADNASVYDSGSSNSSFWNDLSSPIADEASVPLDGAKQESNAGTGTSFDQADSSTVRSETVAKGEEDETKKPSFSNSSQNDNIPRSSAGKLDHYVVRSPAPQNFGSFTSSWTSPSFLSASQESVRAASQRSPAASQSPQRQTSILSRGFDRVVKQADNNRQDSDIRTILAKTSSAESLTGSTQGRQRRRPPIGISKRLLLAESSRSNKPASTPSQNSTLRTVVRKRSYGMRAPRRR